MGSGYRHPGPFRLWQNCRTAACDLPGVSETGSI